MYELLRYAIEKDASDVHITENMSAWIRVRGQLVITDRVIQLDMIDEFVKTHELFLLDEYKLLKSRTIAEYEIDDVSNDEEMSIPADPNVRNFSFTRG